MYIYEKIKDKLSRLYMTAKCKAVGLSYQHQLGFYIKVTNGSISTIKLSNFEERNESVEFLIRSALDEFGATDLGWTFICTDDVPYNSTSRVSYRTCSVSLGDADYGMPDFLFHRWQAVGISDFFSAAHSLHALSLVPAELNKVGWRGAATHPNRDLLVSFVGDYFDLSYVQHADYPANGVSPKFISLEESIRRWSWLVDVEGRGYSARVKLLLASGRPLVLVDRPYIEWYVPEFTAGTHYIRASRDLNDFREKVEWLAMHPDAAQTIGKNAAELSKELFSKKAVLSQVYKSLYKCDKY